MAEGGQRLAIAAEALYLVNLLLVPGLAFLILAVLFLRRGRAGQLARNHLEQAFAASCWAGVLLIGVGGAIVLLGDIEGMITWVVGIIYLVCMHATLVLLGVLGLARALSGKAWRYPLVGWPFR
ncbi:hypothetical protein TspCOW1_22620 [Thiohalobacter sp. COW1]|uniref:hypothetical protein n=1 Tax=Thiohalobacter sp. COW1 TaxID=2795687 RepID=UPI0019169410|nr:hypothetical protein [Thiohalobacter sp. COW1]BCO32159.1 hypothetical protein TspCOW1_22620 [Thiohalobacter sp. COW1]